MPTSVHRLSMARSDKSTPVPDFSNSKCYARDLRGCCPKISAEHFVSERILELVEHGRGKKSKFVSVRRSRGRQEGPRRNLGIANLTGKMLCVEHNGRLSPLDTAGKKMFEAMESIHYGCRTPDAREEVCRVDGDRLERFLLKLLCGSLYSGNLGHESGSMKGTVPPIEWLRILFQDVAFPDGQGLYHIPTASNEIIVADHDILEFTPLFTADFSTVCGLRAWFFAIEFDLLMANLPPGVRTSFDDALYRPSSFRIVGSNARIEFSWKDGPKGDGIVLRRIWRPDILPF